MNCFLLYHVFARLLSFHHVKITLLEWHVLELRLFNTNLTLTNWMVFYIRIGSREREIQDNLRRIGPDICRTHWLLIGWQCSYWNGSSILIITLIIRFIIKIMSINNIEPNQLKPNQTIQFYSIAFSLF